MSFSDDLTVTVRLNDLPDTAEVSGTVYNLELAKSQLADDYEREVRRFRRVKLGDLKRDLANVAFTRIAIDDIRFAT